MYGCSPKKPRIDKNSNWRGYRPCISPGDLLPCMYQFERDLCQMIPIESLWGQKYLVHQGEQMHEHIAYELRYGILVQ